MICILLPTMEEYLAIRSLLIKPVMSVQQGVPVVYSESVPNVRFAIIGEGEDSAPGARKAISGLGASEVYLLGLASGLDKELSPGDVVVCEYVGSDGGTLLPTGSGPSGQLMEFAPQWVSRHPRVVELLGPNPRIAVGKSVTMPAIVTAADEAERLRAAGFACADLDSSFVSEVCQELGSPLAIARAITHRSGAPGRRDISPALYSLMVLAADLCDRYGGEAA